jgi:hypothetical protein
MSYEDTALVMILSILSRTRKGTAESGFSAQAQVVVGQMPVLAVLL